MPEAAVVALVGLAGVVVGAVANQFLAPFLREWFTENWRSRRQAKGESLKLVYEPLYKLLASTPMAPGGTVEDLDFEVLASVLKASEKIISANVRYSQQTLTERASGWEEMYFYKNQGYLAPEMRWLVDHVYAQFEKLRSDLGYE